MERPAVQIEPTDSQCDDIAAAVRSVFGGMAGTTDKVEWESKTLKARNLIRAVLTGQEHCVDNALQWKFEQFIDFATGGKLSKSTWALETLKAAVTEYVNETVQACADDNGSTRWRRNEIPSSKP
jgi:hypothetical protein